MKRTVLFSDKGRIQGDLSTNNRSYFYAGRGGGQIAGLEVHVVRRDHLAIHGIGTKKGADPYQGVTMPLDLETVRAFKQAMEWAEIEILRRQNAGFDDTEFRQALLDEALDQPDLISALRAGEFDHRTRWMRRGQIYGGPQDYTDPTLEYLECTRVSSDGSLAKMRIIVPNRTKAWKLNLDYQPAYPVAVFLGRRVPCQAGGYDYQWDEVHEVPDIRVAFTMAVMGGPAPEAEANLGPR